MYSKKIKKAFKIGFIWFLFSFITSEIASRAALQVYNDNISEALFIYSEYVSWPAIELHKNKVDKNILDAINKSSNIELTSYSEKKITKEIFELLSDEKKFDISRELYTLGFEIYPDNQEVLYMYIISCALSALILMLIVYYMMSLPESRRKIDKD